MNLTTKKALFVGYVLLALISLLFRVTAYSILRYIYLVIVVVTSTSIIMRYTNNRDLYYIIPSAFSLIIGLIIMIMGLTGYEQSLGESVFVIGGSLFLAGAIAYAIKKPVKKYLLNQKYTNKVKTQLIFTFILFTFYFTWIAPDIVTIIQENDYITLLALLLFVVVYLIIHYVLTRYTKKLNFTWIAVIGFVALYTFFRFVFDFDNMLYFQLYAVYLSYGMFISFVLIGDIYYLINVE